MGTLSCGIVCDKLCGGRTDISILGYTLLLLPAVRMLIMCENTDYDDTLGPTIILPVSSVFLLGAGIHGPKTLAGMSLRTLIPPQRYGVGGAMLGVFAQIGVMMSGLGVGWLLHHYQWEFFSAVLLTSSTFACLLVLVLVVSTRWKKIISFEKKML